MAKRMPGSRCGRAQAAEEYYLGAAIAHREFGGPEPTGQEVADIFSGEKDYPRGTEMARLAGFCWQFLRA